MHELVITNAKYPTGGGAQSRGDDNHKGAPPLDVEYMEIPSTTQEVRDACGVTGSGSTVQAQTQVYEQAQDQSVDSASLELQQEGQQLYPARQDCLTNRAKVVLGTVWFVASTLKSMGYYTPIIILVMHDYRLFIKYFFT